MVEQVRIFEILARLLEYPQDGYVLEVEDCLGLMEGIEPSAAQGLKRFQERVRGQTTEQLQEHYVQTFDLNPVCALEVGWQLFGDEYKRGEFLVKMRQEMRGYQLPESTELPDHLTRVLLLLAHMEPERAGGLVANSVLPAVEKMRVALEAKQNPYADVLAAIAGLLRYRPQPALTEVNRD